MKWSWKLCRVFGIDVYLHATFLILLGWTALAGFLGTGKLDVALAGVGLTLAVFAVVVLHELGHALTARKFGIKTRDITLLPIGGLARLDRMPDKPRQELLVALAGPAVNVVLALAIFVGCRFTATDLGPAGLHDSMPFWPRMLWVNVLLAGFNLIPAFPMDGGRALRALLAMRMPYVRATQAAARLGQALALGMGLLGLFFNPFLMFVALFVWIGAAAEAATVVTRSTLRGLPVRAAMLTRFATLGPFHTLGAAAELLLAGSDTDFPVLQAGQLVGIVTRSDLVRGLAERGPDVAVRTVMHTSFQTADPSEMLDAALERLEGCECRVLPVVRDGAVVGLVTPENVAELLMLEGARATSAPRAAWQGETG